MEINKLSKDIMVKKILLTAALCLPALALPAQDDDYENDFGTWWELGAKKELTKQWSVSVDGELRTSDMNKEVDRLGLGIGANYKVNKYLKVGAGYTLLGGHKLEKTKIKEEYDILTGDLEERRVRFTPGYWNNRHRFYVDITPDIKLGKAWHLSLRERYQYTFTPLGHHTRDTRYYEMTGSGLELDREVLGERITDERVNKHVLRSRIKLEYDEKKMDWKPFVSVEAQNNLANHMHLRKLRTAVGTEYKISKHHSAGLAYVFTRSNEGGDKELFHALNISYNFKF